MKKDFKKKLSLLLTVSLIIVTVQAQIINVPVDYPSIQEGINAATEGDTVLVAEGTYYENVNFKGKAITLASHFILTGNQAQVSNTIIDGSKPTYADSASTVTMLRAVDTTSVLCGFTIRGGTGTGPFKIEGLWEGWSINGGGVFHAGGKIVNNIITDNSLDFYRYAYGAGISGGNCFFVDDSNLVTVIRNNIIYGNNVHSDTIYASGGGICLNIVGKLTIVENNKIYDNYCASDGPYKAMGGGIILGNLTSNKTKAIIKNNHIFNNNIHSEHSFGGGMFYILIHDGDTNEFSQTVIQNNIIENNYSQGYGGGIAFWYLWGNGFKSPTDPIVTNNSIVNNTAKYGSGISSIDADVGLFNNIIWNNITEPENTEIFDGYFYYDPFWKKGTNDSKIWASYNNIQNNYQGAGNFSAPPNFKPGTIELGNNSRCVGAGIKYFEVASKMFYPPETDFNGINRVEASTDGRIDLGAIESPYEYQPYLPYTSGKILNVPDEIPTIQEAIDAANDSDTVLVAPGLYHENINYKGKAITVGSHFIMDDDEINIINTVIDGSKAVEANKASVVTMNSGEDSTSVITGFSITGGKGTYVSEFLDGAKIGAGVLIYGNGGKIEMNRIYNNIINSPTYTSLGAGVATIPSVNGQDNIIIRKNLIFENKLETNWNEGAGLCVGRDFGFTLLENNEIFNNSAKSDYSSGYADAGGLIIGTFQPREGLLVMRNNYIHHNSAKSTAGGVFIVLAEGNGLNDSDNIGFEIYNNLITNNMCGGNGGGMAFANNSEIVPETATHFVANNTIINNRANLGQGAYNQNNKPIFLNNILWNSQSKNEVYDANYSSEADTSDVILLYNNVKSKCADAQNINCQPYFSIDSIKFTQRSQNIGGGVSSLELNGVTYYAPATDYFGNPRPNAVDGFIDLGAVESDMAKGEDCEPYNCETIVLSEMDSGNLHVYPNPAQHNLTVEFNATTNSCTLLIFDLNGKQIYTKAIAKGIENTCHSIDVSHLTKGYYIISVSDKAGNKLGSEGIVVY